MCEVATAIAIAGLAIQYQGQQKQASSEFSYREATRKEGESLAKHSFFNQIHLEQTQQSEEDEAASSEQIQIQREGAQARATARVAAGEAGVSGLSVDALLADFDRQEAEYSGSIQRTREFSARQSAYNLASMRANGMSQIASTRYAPIARPSAVEYGLAGAGEYFKGEARYGDAASGQTRTKKTAGSTDIKRANRTRGAV